MSSDGFSPRPGRRADREREKRCNDQISSARPLKFFTIQDVAQMLDVSMRSVRRYVERGELAVHRFGGAVRISDTDLKAFIGTHRDM